MRCGRQLIATATLATLAACTDFDGLRAQAGDASAARPKADAAGGDAAGAEPDPDGGKAACDGAHQRAFGGHCYLFGTADRVWADAEKDCVAWGGHLVTITSVDEHTFVLGVLDQELVASDPGRGAWIGLNDVAAEGVFTWTTTEPVSFTNWASMEPDGALPDKDCVFQYASQFKGRWDDFRCSISTKFVCEW